MNVLSLFDGLGGTRIALDKLGIKIDNYFASEIDKYAIKVATSHYPDIIQLGDIKNISSEIIWPYNKCKTKVYPTPKNTQINREQSDGYCKNVIAIRGDIN